MNFEFSDEQQLLRELHSVISAEQHLYESAELCGAASARTTADVLAACSTCSSGMVRLRAAAPAGSGVRTRARVKCSTPAAVRRPTAGTCLPYHIREQ